MTLTLRRCKGNRGCAKTSAVPGSASFNAPAGPSTIQFRGRLTAKLLPSDRYLAKLRVAGGESKSTRISLI